MEADTEPTVAGPTDKNESGNKPAEVKLEQPSKRAQHWRQGWSSIRQFVVVRWRLVVLVAVVVVLIAAGGVSAYFYHVVTTKPKPTPSNSNSSSTSGSSSTADNSSSSGDIAPPPDTTLKPTVILRSVSFLDAPVKLANLHFFNNYKTYFSQNCLNDDCSNPKPNVSDNNVGYYQVGTTADGKQVLALSIYDSSDGAGIGLPSTISLIALKTGTGQYKLLAIPSGVTSDQVSALRSVLSTNTTLDTTTDIAALEFPNQISVTGSGGATVTLRRDDYVRSVTFLPTGLGKIAASFSTDPTLPTTTFGTNGDKTAYEASSATHSGYSAQFWFIGLHNMFMESYNLQDSFTTSAKSNITWTSGKNTTAGYISADMFDGCGSNSNYVILSPTFDTNTLVHIGTNPNGKPVYALPDGSALLKNYYNSYSATAGISDRLTISQFQANHFVIVAKNSVDEYEIYTDSSVLQPGGCGEPVVYLYPQQTTQVSVRVGADVVKSDPAYPSRTGWLNVTAQPNGQLTYQDKPYSSLVWEGYGYGTYPAINSGTVVPTFLARHTIEEQLQAQGLHQNEITDFLNFWGNKLPETPYTRLTWLNTAQMDALAPLTVTPRPDTLIRVFLDFQGLDQPETLAQQHFTALPRNGFTVVEWGGLLRGGIR